MDISMKTLLSELYHPFRYINVLLSNPFINIYSTPLSSISQSKSTITTLFYDLNENIYMNNCWLASSNYSIITKKTNLLKSIKNICVTIYEQLFTIKNESTKPTLLPLELISDI
ncbi:hypothetical protein WA158_007738 [Blastocystis sp. Blastoise]